LATCGTLAYDEEGWTSDSDYCEIWQGEALRDYALKTGELSRAIAFIKLKFYWGGAPAEHLDVCNHGAAVYLSQLLAASGQPQQALALRRAAASWNDANEAKYLGGSRRLRAGVLLLDGKPDAALTELGRIIPFRVLRVLVVHHKLRSVCGCRSTATRRFQAIAADVRRYVDAQAQPARGTAATRDVLRRETGRLGTERQIGILHEGRCSLLRIRRTRTVSESVHPGSCASWICRLACAKNSGRTQSR